MLRSDPSDAALFERLAPDVYGWASRLLGRHHDALDVVQDVYLKWHAQCKRQTPANPRGWLRRVTINRAIDLRRHSRTVAGMDANAIRTALPEREPAADLDAEALRDDIASALVQLSDIQRNVLVSKVFGELTFAQIAAETHVALSTVKTHYLRAVRSLRDHLQRKWGEEI